MLCLLSRFRKNTSILSIMSVLFDRIRRWRATWNPDMYHGWGRRHSYFEGWYFKIVSPDEQYAFAFIPGIGMDKDGSQHAFVQVLDGKLNKAYYHQWPAEVFKPSARYFELILDRQFFSGQTLCIDLPEIQGELHFNHPHPWPKMLGAPGIMGWYSFVPFMECYHGIVSLDHVIRGKLEIAGRSVDFTGGRGYIEKDWGRSFPSSWIWMQSNHFGDTASDEVISLTASVAKIPWLSSSFIGYIVGFLWRGKLYRFATYTGAMMKAALGERHVQLAFRDKRYRIDITAHKSEGGELISPIDGNMRGKVNESMQSLIEVAFYENEVLLFKGTGRNAGLEIAGPVQTELLCDQWRR